MSHDRELLARAADKVVTIESGPGGSDVWVHGGGFAAYHQARTQRFARFEEVIRSWEDEHAQLKKLVADLRRYATRSDAMASRYHAAQTRLRTFEELGPPPQPPREQNTKMRLKDTIAGSPIRLTVSSSSAPTAIFEKRPNPVSDEARVARHR